MTRSVPLVTTVREDETTITRVPLHSMPDGSIFEFKTDSGTAYEVTVTAGSRVGRRGGKSYKVGLRITRVTRGGVRTVSTTPPKESWGGTIEVGRSWDSSISQSTNVLSIKQIA